MFSTMMRRLLVVAGLVLLPVAARADRLHLENGKTFDDVVLISQTHTHVRFRVASGEMRLPLSWVARIEEAPGALAEYLQRHTALVENPEAPAEEYLELARWARSRGLRHGFRESILAAGELDPSLESLPPLMAAIGYVPDPATKVWVAERSAAREAKDESPQPVESNNSNRAALEASNQEVAAGLTRAIETLAAAELERSRAAKATAEARIGRDRGVQPVYFPLATTSVALTAPGWVFPGAPLRPAGSDPSNPVIRKPANPYARALLARPPGSLLPVSAYQ